MTRGWKGSPRLIHGVLGLVLVLGLGLLPSLARGTEVGVAILGLDAVDVPEEAAQAVTEVLRRQAAAHRGIKVIPGVKELVEVKLIFGCMEEKPGCLAVAGRSLGADRVIYGSVRRPVSGGGITVVLKQLDVRAGRVDRFVSDIVPQRVLHAQSTELLELVQKWLEVILFTGLSGSLEIVSDPPGALVTLDGAAAGKAPLSLSEVLTGKHVAVLALPGYAQVVKTFEVRGGMVHHMDVTLAVRHGRSPESGGGTVPAAPAHPEGPAGAHHEDPGKKLRLASFFLFGAAAISGGIAVYTWRTYTGEEDPSRQALDMLQMNLPGGSPDLVDFFRSSDRASTCQPPAELTSKAVGSPVTLSLYNSYLEHCQRGRNFAGATTGLVATMGSLALLGVITYIVGDRLSRGRHTAADAYEGGKPAAAKTSWRYTPRLRVVSPTVNAHGGGLDLSFQF